MRGIPLPFAASHPQDLGQIFYLCLMAESLHIAADLSKAEKYAALLPQAQALLEPETDLIANLANLAACLKETFGWHWVGFYLMKDGELVLGPFQGPVACTRIAVGRGVCGTTVQRRETLIVPDVDAFPGHIACSSLSRSEIVVPLMAQGVVHGVLDVDSALLNDFDETDRLGLEEFVGLLKKHY